MNDYQDLGALLDEAGRGQPEEGADVHPYTAPIGAPFHDFDVSDWCAFSGCVSDNPQICDTIKDLVVVVDGAAITAVAFVGATLNVHVRRCNSGPVTASALARALVGAILEDGQAELEGLLVKFLGEKVGGL